MPALDFHLQVLGLTGSPTKAQITRAFRREINKWHPDKHQHDGGRQQAEESAKLINAAYAFLKVYEFPKVRDTKSPPPAVSPSPSTPPRPASTKPRSAPGFTDHIIPIDSPLIIAARFDEYSNSLAIFFRDGHISRFAKVPRTLSDKFFNSRSKDVFLERNILPAFKEWKIV